MAGAAHLPSFMEEGFAFGHTEGGVRLGAAKVMLTMTTGVLNPSMEELHRIVAEAHGSGFQVAIHAVEMEAVEAAIDAIKAQSRDPGAPRRHRIEHCSECPPRLVEKLARYGITVATQPGFIYYSGERYLSEVEGERMPWLYPIGSLTGRGRAAGRRLRRARLAAGPDHRDLRRRHAPFGVRPSCASQRGGRRGRCPAVVYAWQRLRVLPGA